MRCRDGDNGRHRNHRRGHVDAVGADRAESGIAAGQAVDRPPHAGDAHARVRGHEGGVTGHAHRRRLRRDGDVAEHAEDAAGCRRARWCRHRHRPGRGAHRHDRHQPVRCRGSNRGRTIVEEQRVLRDRCAEASAEHLDRRADRAGRRREQRDGHAAGKARRVEPVDSQDVADRVVGVRRRVAVLIHHRDEAIQLVIDVVDTRRLSVQPARYEQGAENYDRDRIRCGDGTVSIRCGHKSVRGKARPGPAVCRPSAEFSDQEFGRKSGASPNLVQAALNSGQV